MPQRPTVRQVFWIFLRLGLTSFGGPVAHLGYYRQEFVERRRWLGEGQYGDLVALCQFLPGPASTQVAMGIGALSRGVAGSVAAWAGFSLPSAAAMIAFAYGLSAWADHTPAGLLRGLKVVAVAVVAQAVWGMGRSFCPERLRASLALLAAAGLTLWPGTLGQIAALVGGGAVGWALLRGPRPPGGPHGPAWSFRRRMLAPVLLLAFAGLLAGLPLLAAGDAPAAVGLADRFYRAGSLVFGGGHVVLPLLEAEVVPPGLVEREAFLAGYGAAQALPGPLFTFSGYLGALIGPGMGWAPWAAGLLALVSIFLPSWLLILGVLPFWDAMRRLPALQAAMDGVKAAVVGILLAALYDPVWRAAMHDGRDLALALAAFTLLYWWKAPAWLVVLLAAGAGALLL